VELTYYGAGCVFVATKLLKVLIDPPSPKSGVKLPKLNADVVLHTTVRDGEFERGDHFEIDSPGEYEIKGVSIHGVAAQLHIDEADKPKRGVMYALADADLRLLVTGNIAPELKDSQTEAVGDVNIVVIPVGGHGLTLDATGAAKILSAFEPQYVVPVHYDDGTKYEMPQDKVDTFLNEVGAKDTKPQPKLKVTARDLGEETTVVVLERQGK
jgi:L-ascorbate metabolism protein UlaG (beta-lactamase superfamily)